MAKRPYIFRITNQKFEEINPKLLRYAKPCKAGHCDPEGRGIRLIHSGACIACLAHLPNGAFEHNFGDDVEPKRNQKTYTEEEGKARHIARVMQWQKDNKDKVRPVQARYNAKEEIKAKNRERYEKNKERQQDRQREYYQANREAILLRAREAFAKKQAAKKLNIKDPTTLGT